MLNNIMQIAINHKGESVEMDIEVEVKESGTTHAVHSVSIAYRDLLFYTDKGTLNYDVNTINGRDSMMLVSEDLDD